MKIIKDVNDVIALVILILIIPGLWVAEGIAAITLDGAVLGATIMGWTLVLQYYFRKKASEPKG